MPKDKGYTLPSRDWEISPAEAADTLITAAEIKAHKELNKAARAVLKKKRKAIDKELK